MRRALRRTGITPVSRGNRLRFGVDLLKFGFTVVLGAVALYLLFSAFVWWWNQMRPLILGAVMLLMVACGDSEPYIQDGMPTQNEDGSWTPEFTMVGDRMGGIAGVARHEDVHGELEVYPIPVYSVDDHSLQVGWARAASGSWVGRSPGAGAATRSRRLGARTESTWSLK